MTETRTSNWMIPKYVRFFSRAIREGTELVIFGGAGSGKSYAVAQYLLILFGYATEPLKILVTRKTNPSLRLSALELVKEILSTNNVYFFEQRAEQILSLLDGSRIYFRGMDDPEKIKSAEFNIVWMEEATEFDEQDYRILKLRLRRPQVRSRKGWLIPNQIILTFNPVSVHNWTYKLFFERQNPSAMILHTTYRDNPFLDEEYIRQLEALKNEDKTFYEIYAEGKFATPENLIFTNYRVVKDAPSEFDEIRYGIDFGFNNPTVVLKVGIKDQNVWVLDELYKTKLTNAELIDLLKQFVRERNAPIFADSSEPARIEEIRRAGFNIQPALKDVKAGIDFLKRRTIYISEHCVNTLKEIRNYKWKEDRNGNPLDEPVKFMDHAMDALRYAVYQNRQNVKPHVERVIV